MFVLFFVVNMDRIPNELSIPFEWDSATSKLKSRCRLNPQLYERDEEEEKEGVLVLSGARKWHVIGLLALRWVVVLSFSVRG